VCPWSGVKNCTAYGPSALQNTITSDSEAIIGRQSEDCLYLNVWTPASRRGERLPVMVWIHGGGFLAGSGSLRPMYAERLTEQQHVVLVSVNYRLGVFGFFAHPALSAESPHLVSGNCGLLDQIAALRWVRRNIAAFGGDPRRVTIFGQSAGAQSVIADLVSPLSRGLFARAIVQSARYQDQGVGIWSTRTLAQQQAEGLAIAAKLGVGNGPGAAAALRAVPANQLEATTAPASPAGVHLLIQPPDPSFQPVIDGYVLPDEPWRLLKEGRWARVPLLIGSDRDETGMWLGSIGPSSGGSVIGALRSRVRWVAGPDWPALSAQFPSSAYGSLLRATSRMVTVLEFNAPARFAAQCASSQHVPTYLYCFSRVPPGDTLGAHHGAEIPYVFDSLNPARLSRPALSADLALARAMSSYWANFAATGDPNSAGLPHWPRFAPAKDVLLRLDAPIRDATVPCTAACAIAEKVDQR
jgi:para-nitrobenzyl esterase